MESNCIHQDERKKIMFCGGGTLGPVTPLLAIIEAWQSQDASVEFVFVGTPHGPEQELMKKEQIKFYSLPAAKLPRYLSLEWLCLPFRALAAFYAAWAVLKKERPVLIVSAGGYTSVPLVIIGWFMRIPALVHQQDVRPLLSNKLTAPFASIVTVAWEKSLQNFSKGKIIGNPVRPAFLQTSKEAAMKHFNLSEAKPIVLFLGGGTGSLWLNRCVSEIVEELSLRANIIHLTGKGKTVGNKIAVGYRTFELLTEEMPLAMAAADLVVCRAGMATITELAAMKKAAAIIPLPNSPQEDNAAALTDAVVVLRQGETTSAVLLKEIIRLLDNSLLRAEMGEKLSKLLKTDVAREMVEIGQGIIRKSQPATRDCC